MVILCLLKLGGVLLVISNLVDDGSRSASGSKVSGIVLGLVTKNDDSSGMNRVKVNFPWFNQQYESGWARVATFMSGGDRGAFFLPEVGDEVIVAFEHGDINHPYVIGSLWNGADKAPEFNSDKKNNIRKIKSRSGHEIIFDDDNNGKKEKIEIHSNSGHSITLNDSAGGEKIEIKDKSGNNSILIDSVQNAINISSKMKLSIKSTDVTIESDGMMTIKASGNLTIQGALVKIN